MEVALPEEALTGAQPKAGCMHVEAPGMPLLRIPLDLDKSGEAPIRCGALLWGSRVEVQLAEPCKAMLHDAGRPATAITVRLSPTLL